MWLKMLFEEIAARVAVLQLCTAEGAANRPGISKAMQWQGKDAGEAKHRQAQRQS